MPKFVLHVGPHKTGSTYLQSRLSQNHALFKQQRIDIPTDWEDDPGNPSHSGIRKLMASDREALKRRFEDWIKSDFNFVVISSEDMAAFSPEALRYLGDILRGQDFTVVYYVRSWPQLLASSWAESVVHGGLVGLPEFVLDHILDPWQCQYIAPGVNVDRFVDALGEDHVRLVSYDSVISSGSDLFDHFVATFLGAIQIRPSVQPTVNVSLTVVESELIRHINGIHQALGAEPSSLIVQIYRGAKHIVRPERALDRLANYMRTLNVDTAKRPLANVVSGSFPRYRSLMVAPHPRGMFYEPKLVPLSYISCKYASDADLLGEIASVRTRILSQGLRPAPASETAYRPLPSAAPTASVPAAPIPQAPSLLSKLLGS
ncbi:MAG: hypothetical protein ACU0B1_09740 [Thermohalobaculum sp.]